MVASNFHASPPLLRWLATDSSLAVQHQVALNPSTPPDVLVTLSHHPSEDIRWTVARNWVTPPEILMSLANDPKDFVRASVADHPHTPPILLAQLANDPTHSVHRSVANNPHTPPTISAQLVPQASADCATDLEQLPPHRLLEILIYAIAGEIALVFATLMTHHIAISCIILTALLGEGVWIGIHIAGLPTLWQLCHPRKAWWMAHTGQHLARDYEATLQNFSALPRASHDP
jgi:hypothetical protein